MSVQPAAAAYTWDNVAIGGGFVSAVIPSKTQGIVYARTDVGGAYRWDNTNPAGCRCWIGSRKTRSAIWAWIPWL